MLRHVLSISILLATANYAVMAPATAQTAAAPTFSAKSKLGELMDDPRAMAVLQKHIPDVMADPEITKGRKYSLRFISGFDKRIKAALPAIERDLAAIR
ncbi:hypothetical protein [Blastomonas sp. UPD001]|uniref:hypothetical protein n=1 Tax=Blastomonas sp. UPD001 TaxID=2217673 RepID=UPI000E3411C7|nr:hypothetical protein [Blastomonas sp. UPD001]